MVSAGAQTGQSEDLKVGTRVMRGPDWEWQDQDGGDGKLGKVIESKADRGSDQWVRVEWDNGYANTYRWGGEDPKFDLTVVESPK